MLSQVQTQAIVATCPACEQRIRLAGKVFLSRQVTCPNCKTQFTVIETAPIKLDWVFEEWDVNEDDW